MTLCIWPLRQRRMGANFLLFTFILVWQQIRHRPKGGLFVHKNLSFNTFEATCANFLLDFRYCWPPFSLLLLFLTPHFYKTLDSVGSIFSLHAGPLGPHRKFGEVPPPPGIHHLYTSWNIAIKTNLHITHVIYIWTTHMWTMQKQWNWRWHPCYL